MCTKWEAVDDLSVDCEQCGKRIHASSQDPVCKFLDYFGSPNHSRTRFMLFHTTLVDTTQFLLKRFMELRLVPQMIMDCSNVLSVVVEKLHYLDSLNYLPESQEHAQIIQHHTQGVLYPLLQHDQKF